MTDAIENIISFEVAGELVSCLIRYNIEISYPTGYISNNRDLHGIRLYNISLDAIIPRPKNIEENIEKNLETVVYSPKVYGTWNGGKSLVSKAHAIYSWRGSHNEWELRDSKIYYNTKMTGMWDNVSKEPKMDRLVIELEPGAEGTIEKTSDLSTRRSQRAQSLKLFQFSLGVSNASAFSARSAVKLEDILISL